MRYLGYEEKQRFANELSGWPCRRTFGVRAQRTTGDRVCAGCEPKHAAARSSGGNALAVFDHDVLCRTNGAPEPDEVSLSIFSECDPFARWTYADPATADRIARWETPDFLALHESMLGRGTGELIPAEAGHKTIDFQHAKDAILQRLATDSTRIRATFCGHSGEPGVPSAVYYLAYRGANRKRLTSSEAHYRAPSPAAACSHSPLPRLSETQV